MARTFRDIEIEGKDAFVLFDTGSLRSYVRIEFASQVKRKIRPFEVGLGGHFPHIEETGILGCAIEGLEFDIEARPVERLGLDE